jgi:hypothetical protein
VQQVGLLAQGPAPRGSAAVDGGTGGSRVINGLREDGTSGSPDHLSGHRILAIITLRPEFSPPWIGRSNVTTLTLNRLAPRRRAEMIAHETLTLNRLAPRQRAEMIAHVTGGKALPREIAEQIVDRTDGVPLFTVHAIRDPDPQREQKRRDETKA